MDISHFGLFDLSTRRPTWTDRAGIASVDGVGLTPPQPARIANDNGIEAGKRRRRIALSDRRAIHRTLLRLVGQRGSEPGRA
jgi:hypothetical protein